MKHKPSHPKKPADATLWKHWYEVESKIHEEMMWLRNAVALFAASEKEPPNIGCRECFLRKIAFKIVSGKITANEITKAPQLNSFWLPKRKRKGKRIFHGKEWHRETMERIESHFLTLGYQVTREPTVYQGRADLGVYKDGEPTLYIEVGTVTSFYKVLVNLEAMRDAVYLLVPNDERLIEFRKTTAPSPFLNSH